MLLDGPVTSQTDVTLLYLIKQVELAVRTRLDAVVGEHGLTSLQYTALTVLERHPGMTSADLARNSFVRAQTMAQMVVDLEAKGHVYRSHTDTETIIHLYEERQARVVEAIARFTDRLG